MYGPYVGRKLSLKLLIFELTILKLVKLGKELVGFIRLVMMHFLWPRKIVNCVLCMEKYIFRM